MKEYNKKEDEDFKMLCRVIRNYVKDTRWEECMVLIPKYMELYPDSGVPHNLMGIVLESRGFHPDAMRHFRAALALDATYFPARYNLDMLSNFDKGKWIEPLYEEPDYEGMDKRGN